MDNARTGSVYLPSSNPVNSHTVEVVNVAFRDDVRLRAGGKCECTMKQCTHHSGRCRAMLRGEWETHRRTAGGSYTLSNVVAMCQTCHRNTPSYGVGNR